MMTGTWAHEQVAKLYRAWAGSRPHARPQGVVFDTLSRSWRTGRQLYRRVKRTIQSIQFELDEPLRLTGCGSLTGRVTSRRGAVVRVEAFVGQQPLASGVPEATGRFRLFPTPGILADGQHAVLLIAHTTDGRVAMMTTTLVVDRFTLADSPDLPERLHGSDREYQHWLKLHDVHDIPPCEQMRILVRAEDKAGEESVRRQTHRNWQWWQDDVVGDVVIAVPAGYELHPQALAALAWRQCTQPASLYYFDDDVKDADCVRHSPRFKPGWSPTLARHVDFLEGVHAWQPSISRPLEGMPSIVGYIPGIFVHRSPAVMAGVQTVPPDRPQVSHEGSCIGLSSPSRLKTELQPQPRVSILIPTRDQPRLLRRCIGSLRRHTSYRNYEIIVIDNGSTTPAMASYLSEGHADRVIRVDEPFNHSRLNNLAARQATGELLLLLNDDTELLDGGWLEAMLQHAQEHDVGAVGAWLDFPDGTIQHAGIVLDADGIAYNLGSELLQGGGQEQYLRHAREVSAVTGACLLVRKDRYLDLGGLDEAVFPTSYNDVDFCLRLAQQGYRCIVEPAARLLHHESASRRCGEREAGYRERMRERWGERLGQEYYRNPWLSRASDRAKGLVYHWG